MSYLRSGDFVDKHNVGNIDDQRGLVVTNYFIPDGMDFQEQHAKQYQQHQLHHQQLQQQHEIEQQPQLKKGITEGGMREQTKKWSKTQNRISRGERIRVRNIKLSKILQPRNAVKIFNELVKDSKFIVQEFDHQFRAAVMYDEIEHEGYALSKFEAKNEAAEAALKHLFRSQRSCGLEQDFEGNEKLDIAEDESVDTPLPWQHVASFALYKLLSSWGEDPETLKITTSSLINTKEHKTVSKSAKKMPESPEYMNPIMLVNQMLPQARYEEIGQSGDIHVIGCYVDGQSFLGSGTTKKQARKMAAFGVCYEILGVQYPPDIYAPNH